MFCDLLLVCILVVIWKGFSSYLVLIWVKNEPRYVCVCARVIVCRCVLVWCMGVCSMLALPECDVRRLDAIKTWVNNSIASLCWQLLQQDIESHSRIVSAVLKLSERLENDRLTCSCDPEESLQLVALNLQKRWHGIWLQSLEWQCRLEEAINRRKVRMNYGSVALNGFCCTSKGHPFRQMSSTVQTQIIQRLCIDNINVVTFGRRMYLSEQFCFKYGFVCKIWDIMIAKTMLLLVALRFPTYT